MWRILQRLEGPLRRFKKSALIFVWNIKFLGILIILSPWIKMNISSLIGINFSDFKLKTSKTSFLGKMLKMWAENLAQWASHAHIIRGIIIVCVFMGACFAFFHRHKYPNRSRKYFSDLPFFCYFSFSNRTESSTFAQLFSKRKRQFFHLNP